MEFNANYMNGTAVPSWLCGGSIDKWSYPTWEIAYNHYNGRRGISLPNTLKYIYKVRPTDAKYHMVWETITHAGLGNNVTAAKPEMAVHAGVTQPKTSTVLRSGAGKQLSLALAVQGGKGDLHYYSLRGARLKVYTR